MNYIRYGSQTIDKSDIKSVSKCLTSNFLTTGPEIIKFEKNFSKYTGSKYALACSNGTAALHIAFLSIGLKKNDNVILPAINFIAAANMSNLIGAKIFFADVDEISGQMTPKTLLECLKKNKIKKIKAFCTMHHGGMPNNAREFYKIKKKLKCYLIEDGCHALGGMYSKKKKEYVGNCKYADISTFSFHPVKSITTGEGGMLVTNKKNLIERARLLRNHGMNKKNLKQKNNWFYQIKSIGFNYRMNEIQASLGISQLKKLNKFIKQRNYVAIKYKSLFKMYDFINQLSESNNDLKSAWHLFIINFNFKSLKISKDEFIQKLHKKKIGVQVHYIPNNIQPLYSKNKFKLTGARKYFENSLSIPIYPNLKINEINKVANSIIKLIIKYKKKNY